MTTIKEIKSDNADSYRIIDIGGSLLKQSCLRVLQEQFFKPRAGKLPFIDAMLMSSEAGLQLWSHLTYLPDYYQTREEISLLRENGADIARHIVPGCAIIDLGSGDTRKIEPLLNHLDSGGYDVTYYSVDLSRSSLARGLDKLSSRYKHVELVGLWGTFEDALPWCQKIDSPRLLISLGSMFGTDRWDDSIRELTAWATLMNPNDRFLIGIDSHADRDKIWASYHDVEGLFEQFIRTGLAYTNDVLGHEWYRDEDWVLEGEFDENPLVHRFVLTASRDVHSPELNLQFKAGSKIECYEGHKYTPNEIKRQFKLSGLSMLEGLTWKSPDGEIYDYMLSKSQDDKPE